MCIGPFSESRKKSSLMINDRVLTTQEWCCVMEFVTNLVVENLAKKHNTLAGIKDGRDYL
jgi:hypothetical protein